MDRAISGANLGRSGIQSLLVEAANCKFDIVYAEALDRISRDQEDVAGVYKRLRFADVRIITLAEGEISELHVGLKGTMNALFLTDLANKTRRGLRGRVEAGRSGGGLTYGYDVVRTPRADGTVEVGARRINEAEAEVVCRICREYGAGNSPRAIAVGLNRDGIAGPRGRGWGASTINGNAGRGTGILNNRIYIGKLVWNKLRYVKDPDTGKRRSKANKAEAVIEKMFRTSASSSKTSGMWSSSVRQRLCLALRRRRPSPGTGVGLVTYCLASSSAVLAVAAMSRSARRISAVRPRATRANTTGHRLNGALARRKDAGGRSPTREAAENSSAFHEQSRASSP